MNWSRRVAVTVGVLVAVLSIMVIGGLLFVIFFGVPSRRPVPFELSTQMLTPLQFALSNRVEIADHPTLHFGRGPFTISFWFRTNTDRKYTAMIAKRRDALGDGWIVGTYENNGLYFYTAGCASPISRPQNFCDGKWHHYALVRNGQETTFYFDNQNVGSGPDTCDHNDINPLRIGMDADKGWHFDGEIAEVHIYNRALALVEIAEEWNDGRARKTPVSGGGLVAGYHFDEKSGSTAADFSGNRNNGTLIRSPESAAVRSN